MADSFTGEPGAMSYDDDASGRQPNAVCPQCGRDYWRGRDDDGWLCDFCVSEAWTKRACERRDKAAS